MKNLLIYGLILLSVLPSTMAADDTGDSAQGGEMLSSDKPAFREIKDVPGLPRVLLIGDSISIGYTAPVRKALKGIANVHRVPTNAGDTKKGLENIDQWLGDGKWDVIHFNWGMHDIKYLSPDKQNVPPEEYKKNLETLVQRLQKTGATLIWASTTPVPEDDTSPLKRIPKDIVAYNEIAASVMHDHGVLIDDLYSAVYPRESEVQLPKNVHYKPEGNRILSEQVADSISSALKSRSSQEPSAPEK